MGWNSWLCGQSTDLDGIAITEDSGASARYEVYSGEEKRLVPAAHFRGWGCSSGCVMGATGTFGTL